MKWFLVLLFLSTIMIVSTGCVVGPLPPSEDLRDPQQAADLSSEGRERMDKLRELEYIRAEEEEKHQGWDEEDWKLHK